MHDTTHSGNAVNREEAARLLAEAESRRPVASARDVRIYAGFAAAIAGTMAVGTVAIMLTNWATIPYVAALFGLIWWQRRAAGANPLGAGRTYTWGIVGSGVMIPITVIGLHTIRTTIGLTWWWYIIGATVVAVPGLVAATLIARRNNR